MRKTLTEYRNWWAKTRERERDGEETLDYTKQHPQQGAQRDKKLMKKKRERGYIIIKCKS